MIQHCFPGLKPPQPTLRTERVARRIAERIVSEVNLDEFYWTGDTVPQRIDDVQREIRRAGNPASVFDRLYKQQPFVTDAGGRGGDPYGWEGVSEHCHAIAEEIAAEELAKALRDYQRDYGT